MSEIKKFETQLLTLRYEVQKMLEALPAKAIAKKHREKLDFLPTAMSNLIGSFQVMKEDLLLSEEEMAEDGKKAAERLLPWLTSTRDACKKEIEEFFSGRTSLSSGEISWISKLFQYIVEYEIKEFLVKRIKNGATLKEVQNIAVDNITSEAQTLNNSSSSTHNLVTEYKTKVWAKILYRIF